MFTNPISFSSPISRYSTVSPKRRALLRAAGIPNISSDGVEFRRVAITVVGHDIPSEGGLTANRIDGW